MTADFYAKYIITYAVMLGKPVSNLKLNLLLYLMFEDYLALTGKPLFLDDFYAWKIGAVVPSVYYQYVAYGGKPINNIYNLHPISPHIHTIIEKFIRSNIDRSVLDISNQVKRTDGAYNDVYSNKNGYKTLIPFSHIRFFMER